MNLGVAVLGGVAMGAAAAVAVGLAPAPLIEGLVSDSGLPAVLAAAEPPLGMTARAGLALGTGGIVALFGWFGCFLIFGSRTLSFGKGKAVEGEDVPVLRRADAHPDAPARAPLLATRDLGTPFLEITARPAKGKVDEVDSVADLPPLFAPQPVAAPEPVAEVPPAPVAVAAPVEQDLPLDLEQPLAAYDPQSILETPMPAPVAPAPLSRPRPAVFDETERFEIFELTPPVRPRPAPPPQLRPVPRPAARAAAPAEAIATPRTDATIHALLDRLEKGVVKQGIASGAEAVAPAPREPQDRGLEDALVTLRNLARRA